MGEISAVSKSIIILQKLGSGLIRIYLSGFQSMIHINGFFHEITKAKSKSECRIRFAALDAGKNMRILRFPTRKLKVL